MMRTMMVGLWVIVAMSLGGCASLRMEEPPSCDGSDKRPLNAGKWDDVVAGYSVCGR